MITRERDYFLARWVAGVAGGLDVGAGLGLLALPALLLPLLRVPVPGAEALVFLRFVGAFVGAVGVVYWLALWLGGRSRLRAVLELTLVFRVATGLYVAVAIGRGAMSLAWLAVPLADAAIVGVQGWILRREGWSRG